MQEAVEEELVFWAELGWTSNRQSCGALDGRVPRTMVLDIDVGLGVSDGGSELRVLVVAIIVSAEMRPRRRIIDVILSFFA